MIAAALLNIEDQTAPQNQKACRQQLHFERTAVLAETKLHGIKKSEKTRVRNESIGQNANRWPNPKHWFTTSFLQPLQ